jgi:hypothetical protein
LDHSNNMAHPKSRGVALLVISYDRTYVIAQSAYSTCNRPTWSVASSRIAP